jgi:nicotinamidase-related amidase
MPGIPISIGYKRGMPTRSQAALLLIDMQKESRYGIEGVDEAVAAAEGVIAACRTAGVPVVYTRHVNRRDGVGVSIGEVFDAEDLPVYYPAETDAIKIFDAIEPQPRDVVIDKHRWSGFHGTSLDLILRSLGARELFIGGFTTDCCVLTSVYDAYARDYRVSLVPDMCAATNMGSHHAAILMMANWVYGIEILTAAELIKKVAGEPHRSWRATAPDQRQFTAETLQDSYESLL